MYLFQFYRRISLLIYYDDRLLEDTRPLKYIGLPALVIKKSGQLNLRNYYSARVKQWFINPPNGRVLPKSSFFLSLSLSTSIVTVAVPSCTRDNEAATQFRDVWIPHCFPHRFHRDGAITARALNGPGSSPPSAPRSGATTWHTRRRISSRKVRGAASQT